MNKQLIVKAAKSLAQRNPRIRNLLEKEMTKSAARSLRESNVQKVFDQRLEARFRITSVTMVNRRGGIVPQLRGHLTFKQAYAGVEEVTLFVFPSGNVRPLEIELAGFLAAHIVQSNLSAVHEHLKKLFPSYNPVKNYRIP